MKRAVALALDVCQPCTAAVTLELITDGSSQARTCRGIFTVESGVTPVTAPKGTVTSPLPPAPLCFPHPSRPQHSSVTCQKLFHHFFREQGDKPGCKVQSAPWGLQENPDPNTAAENIYLTYLAASSARPVTSSNPAQAQAGRL